MPNYRYLPVPTYLLQKIVQVEALKAEERLGQWLQSQVEGPCESTKATEYQAGQSKGTIPIGR